MAELDRRGRPSAAACARRPVRVGAVCFVLLAIGLAGCRSGAPPTLVERADAVLAKGDRLEAARLYREAAVQDPDNVRAWHGRAVVALLDAEPEASLGFYVEIARRDREYLQSHARLDYSATLIAAGHERLARGRSDGAVRALKAAREITPGVPGLDQDLGRALTARGERLSMLGHSKRALADFNQAIVLTPGRAEPYVGAAQILLAHGRKDAALKLLAVARRHHPSDLRVRALTIEAVGPH